MADNRNVSPVRGQEQDITRSTEWLGAYSTERSLICAITAGRMLERHICGTCYQRSTFIITSDLGGVGHVRARSDGCCLVASIDVEWTSLLMTRTA